MSHTGHVLSNVVQMHLRRWPIICEDSVDVWSWMAFCQCMTLQLRTLPVNDNSIKCTAPSEPEVAFVVKKLKNGKAPGICGITAEHLKSGGQTVITRLPMSL